MSELTRRRFVRNGAAAISAGYAAPLLGSNGSPAMDDALELLAGTGPEYHGGLANHEPMGAEALVALGRPRAVVPWVERYRKRLDGRPTGHRPIREDGWNRSSQREVSA